MISDEVKIIECPRDAMQGIHEFIPTDLKVKYINQLLKVGFNTIDAGSFVSPKAIPQLRDTAEVFDRLDLTDTTSKILAIIANKRGAEDAVKFKQIAYLGYPLSLSETFQQRNTNRSIETALNDLSDIQDRCIQHGKELVVYLSMGFGNPYGDPYDAAYLEEFTKKLDELEVGIISLADTIGISNAANISMAFNTLIPKYPHITIGAHLHSAPADINGKVEAAFEAGCKRFDGAILGFGGCPMAEDDLVGNMATETMLTYFKNNNIGLNINETELQRSIALSREVFQQA